MRRWLAVGGVGALWALVASCGVEPTLPTIPADAQQVHVVTNGGVIRVVPGVVRAGEVWFVFQPDPETQHTDAMLAHRGGDASAEIEPLTDADVALMRQDPMHEDLVGLTYEAGFGAHHRAIVAPGHYVLILTQADGQPPPAGDRDSIAVLRVEP